MNYFLHTEHGQILQVGTIQESIRHLMTREGCTMQEGRANLTDYWDGQKVVPIPEKPSEFHKFDYTTKQWIVVSTLAWKIITAKRNELLALCDWTQLPDVPEATKDKWKSYRQALRDITEQSDPTNIVWPINP